MEDRVSKFLKNRNQFEKKLKKQIIEQNNFGQKFIVSDFIKEIANICYEKSINFNSIIKMRIPYDISEFDKMFFIKNPVKLNLNLNSNQHFVECKFGSGFFVAPKQIIKNVYAMPHRCHYCAFKFAIYHNDLKPSILTGFYNRTQDIIDNPSNGFLHSVCQFNLNGQSKIFDGAHNIVIDEDLYKKLFNFTQISKIENDELFSDMLKVEDFDDFDVVEYFIGKNIDSFEQTK